MNTSTFRMSKELSISISRELMQKKFKEASVLSDTLSEYLTIIAERQVPEDIKQLFKKYPDYFNISKIVYLNEKGFNRCSLTLLRNIPTKGSSYIQLKMTDAEYSKAKKLHNEYQNKLNDNSRIKQEIQTALLNLKTFANIEKSFPEALPFLPKQNNLSLAVAVNLTKLRKEIK